MALPPQVEQPIVPERYAWRVPYIGHHALCIGVLYKKIDDPACDRMVTDKILVEGLLGILHDIAKLPRAYRPAVCDYTLRCFERGVENAKTR